MSSSRGFDFDFGDNFHVAGLAGDSRRVGAHLVDHDYWSGSDHGGLDHVDSVRRWGVVALVGRLA